MRLSLLLALLLLNLGCSSKTDSGEVVADRTETEHTVSDSSARISSLFSTADDAAYESAEAERAEFMERMALDSTVEAHEDVEVLPEHVKIALGFADDPATPELEGGVVENPNNRSPDIDRWLGDLGLEPFMKNGIMIGYPYCAAFVSFCLEQAGNVSSPKKRSAGSRQFIKKDAFHADLCAQSMAALSDKCTTVLPARIAQRGVVMIKPGYLAIWKANKNLNDTSGHIGFVRKDWIVKQNSPDSMLTVEGNTSSGRKRGSVQAERDGGGVYLRKRVLEPANWFRITDFRPVVLNEGT